MRCSVSVVVTARSTSACGTATCAVVQNRYVSNSTSKSSTPSSHTTTTTVPAAATILERNLLSHRHGLAPTHSSSPLPTKTSSSMPHHQYPHQQRESSWETAFELFASWLKLQKGDSAADTNTKHSFTSSNHNCGTATKTLLLSAGATRYFNSVLRIATEDGAPGRSLKAAEVVLGGLHGVLNPRSSIGGRSIIGGSLSRSVIQPNSDTYEALLRASGKVGAWRTALRLFENYREEVIIEMADGGATPGDADSNPSSTPRSGVSPYAILLALRALSEASSSSSSSLTTTTNQGSAGGSHPWELALCLFHQYRHRLMSLSSTTTPPHPSNSAGSGLLPVYWESQRLLLSALRNAGRAQEIVSHFEREHHHHGSNSTHHSAPPCVHSCNDVVRMYAIGAYHTGRWDMAITLASSAFEKTLHESGTMMERERNRRMQHRRNRRGAGSLSSSGYCSSVLEGPSGMGMMSGDDDDSSHPQHQPPVGVKSTSSFESAASLISCAIMTLHTLAGASSTSKNFINNKTGVNKHNGSVVPTRGDTSDGVAPLSEHQIHIRRIVSLYSSVVRSEVRAIVALSPPSANTTSSSNNLFLQTSSSSPHGGVENSLLFEETSPYSTPSYNPSQHQQQPYYVSDFAAALSEDALSAVAVAAVKVGVFAVASHAYNHHLLRRQLQSGSANPWMRGVPHTIPGQLLNAQLLALESRGCHEEVTLLVQSVVLGTTTFPDSDQVLLQLQRLLIALKGAEFSDLDKERLLRSTIERFHGGLNSLEFALIGQCVLCIRDAAIRSTAASRVLLNRLRSQPSDTPHRILSSTLSITRELLISTTILNRPLPHLLPLLCYLRTEASIVYDQLHGISPKSAQEHADRISRGLEDQLDGYLEQQKENNEYDNLVGLSWIREQFTHEVDTRREGDRHLMMNQSFDAKSEARVFALVELFMSTSSGCFDDAAAKELLLSGEGGTSHHHHPDDRTAAQILILCLSYNTHLALRLVDCRDTRIVAHVSDVISNYCRAILVKEDDVRHAEDLHITSVIANGMEDEPLPQHPSHIDSEEAIGANDAELEMIFSGVNRSEMYRYPSLFHSCFRSTILPITRIPGHTTACSLTTCGRSSSRFNECVFELQCSWMMTGWYHTSVAMKEPYQFDRFWDVWGTPHFQLLLTKSTTTTPIPRLFEALWHSAHLCVNDLATTNNTTATSTNTSSPPLLRIRFIVDSIRHLLPTLIAFNNSDSGDDIISRSSTRLVSSLVRVVLALTTASTTTLEGLSGMIKDMTEVEIMDLSVMSHHHHHHPQQYGTLSSSSSVQSLLCNLRHTVASLEGILDIMGGFILLISKRSSGDEYIVDEVCRVVALLTGTSSSSNNSPIHAIREFFAHNGISFDSNNNVDAPSSSSSFALSVKLGLLSEMILMLSPSVSTTSSSSTSIQRCHFQTLHNTWVAGLAGHGGSSAGNDQSLVLNRVALLELTQYPFQQASLLDAHNGEHLYFTLLRTAISSSSSTHPMGAEKGRTHGNMFNLGKDTMTTITALLTARSDGIRRLHHSTRPISHTSADNDGLPFLLSDPILSEITSSSHHTTTTNPTSHTPSASSTTTSPPIPSGAPALDRQRLEAIRSIEKLTPLSRMASASLSEQGSAAIATTTSKHVPQQPSQLSLRIEEEEQRFGHESTDEELSRERVQQWLKNALRVASTASTNSGGGGGVSSLAVSRQCIDKLLKASQLEASRGGAAVGGRGGLEDSNDAYTTSSVSARKYCGSWLWDVQCVMMFVGACYRISHPTGIVAIAHALSQLTMLGYTPPNWASANTTITTTKADKLSSSEPTSCSFEGMQMLDRYTRGHLPIDPAFIAGLLAATVATQIQILSTNIYHKPLFICGDGSQPVVAHDAHVSTLVSSIETLHDLLQSTTPSNSTSDDVFPWLCAKEAHSAVEDVGSSSGDVGMSLEMRMARMESSLSRLVTVSSGSHVLSKRTPPASKGLFAVATLFARNDADNDHHKWITERRVAMEMLGVIHHVSTTTETESSLLISVTSTSISQFTEVVHSIVLVGLKQHRLSTSGTTTATTPDPTKSTNVVDKLSSTFRTVVSGLELHHHGDGSKNTATTSTALKQFGAFLRGDLHPYLLSTILIDTATSSTSQSSTLRPLLLKAISSLLKNGKRAMELTNNVPMFTMHNVVVADIDVIVSGLILAKQGTLGNCATQCNWIAKVFTAASKDSGIVTTPFVTSLTLALLRVLLKQDRTAPKGEASMAAEGIYHCIESLIKSDNRSPTTTTNSKRNAVKAAVPLKHIVATLRIMAADGGTAEGEHNATTTTTRPKAILQLWRSCPSLQRESYLWKYSLREGVLPYLSILRAARDAITRDATRSMGLYMILSAIRSFTWTVLQEGQERRVEASSMRNRKTRGDSSSSSPSSGTVLMAAPAFSENAKLEMSRAIFSTVKDLSRCLLSTHQINSQNGDDLMITPPSLTPPPQVAGGVMETQQPCDDDVGDIVMGSKEDMIADIGRLLSVLHKKRLVRTTTLHIYEQIHPMSTK